MRTVLKGTGRAGPENGLRRRSRAAIDAHGFVVGKNGSKRNAESGMGVESEGVDQAQSQCGWVLTLRASREME